MQRLVFIDKVNNVREMDIDDNTVIAITYQCYDIKEPAKRFKNTSNNFSIPATNRNMAFLGFAGHINSFNDTIYESIRIRYYIDNNIVIQDGSIRIDEISNGRISCTITENESNLNILKTLYWDKDADNSLIQIYFYYLNYVLRSSTPLPDINNKFTGTFSELITYIKNNFSGLLDISTSFTNLYNLNPENLVEYLDENTKDHVIAMYDDTDSSIDNNGFGCHFVINMSVLLRAITWAFKNDGTGVPNGNAGNYGYNNEIEINDSETGVKGSLWASEKWYGLYLFAPGILIDFDETEQKFYFTFRSILSDESIKFAGKQSVKDKENKTAYDLIYSIAQQLNCLITEAYDNTGKTTLTFRNLDLINSYSNVNVIDWSKNFKQINKFKPAIDGMAIDNIITYKSIYDTGVVKKLITSLNENLNIESKYLEINSHYPSKFNYVNSAIENDSVVLLNDDNSFSEFIFLRKRSYNDADIYSIQFNKNGITNQAGTYLKRFNIAEITDEDENGVQSYSITRQFLLRPRFYEIEKYITFDEIQKLDFFNQYYFDQLGGSFFINKITGYNPLKSQEATKIELIFVSNKIPAKSNPFDNFWVDGIGDIWVDGIGDPWGY